MSPLYEVVDLPELRKDAPALSFITSVPKVNSNNQHKGASKNLKKRLNAANAKNRNTDDTE